MNHLIRLSILTLLLANSRSAHAAIIAYDSASDPAYADGWTDGDNGGYGFQPWELWIPETCFIDNGPLAENSLGAPAFGMFTSDFLSGSERVFAPLAVGSRFEMDIDIAGFTAGDFLVAANIIFSDFVGSGGDWQLDLTTSSNTPGFWALWERYGGEVDTGIAVGDPFHLGLAITGAAAYELTLVPIAGGAPSFSQSGVTAEIDSIALDVEYWGFEPLGEAIMLFFDNMQISPIPEPASALLLLLGITALTSRRRRKPHSEQPIEAARGCTLVKASKRQILASWLG